MTWLDVEVKHFAKEPAMRVLILTRPGRPHDDLDMARYHDELVRAGVLLAGDLAAGFWLLEVDSRAEAAEWGRRVPGGDAEIREVADRGGAVPRHPDEFSAAGQSVLPWED